MEDTAWLLGAGAILTGIGSVTLAVVSFRNPIELGSSFNPIHQKPQGIKNVRRLHRAAKHEAWKRAGAYLLATGLLFQALHVLLDSNLDGIDWLGAGTAVAIISGITVREWYGTREAVLEGAGGWVVADGRIGRDS